MQPAEECQRRAASKITAPMPVPAVVNSSGWIGIGSLVLAEEEVRAETQGGTQSPEHADWIESESGPQVEDEGQTDDRQSGACCWPRWPALRSRPVPVIRMTGARYSSSRATPTERYSPR